MINTQTNRSSEAPRRIFDNSYCCVDAPRAVRLPPTPTPARSAVIENAFWLLWFARGRGAADGAPLAAVAREGAAQAQAPARYLRLLEVCPVVPAVLEERQRKLRRERQCYTRGRHELVVPDAPLPVTARGAGATVVLDLGADEGVAVKPGLQRGSLVGGAGRADAQPPARPTCLLHADLHPSNALAACGLSYTW